MSQMSDYLENKLINLTLRNTAYTAPATVYIALYTNNPTDADIGTECNVGAYARQAVTFGAPSNGVTTNSADVTFPVVTSGSETVTHFGIIDAATNGNLLYYAPLTTPRALVTNNQLIFITGQITVTLA